MVLPLAHVRTFETLAAPGDRAEARDRDALAAELLPLLYRQMRALAGPRSDLDDLVQAAAERALAALPSFEGRSAFSTWTYGVAYRTLLDHERWYRRWTRRFRLGDERSTPEPVASADDDPEERVTRAARAASLRRALDELPPAKRAVLVLHDLQGVELARVAAIVGTNERTVRSRIIDGRKQLARRLAADPLFDESADGKERP